MAPARTEVVTALDRDRDVWELDETVDVSTHGLIED